MWNDGDEIDFGDEDDVGALLAKARTSLSAGANLPKKTQHGANAGLAEPALAKAQEAVDLRKLIAARIPTVSSSSFTIKQPPANSVSSDDGHTSNHAIERRLSGQGQPLANVTNSITTTNHLGRRASVEVKSTAKQRQAFQAPAFVKQSREPLARRTSTDSTNLFKAPFPKDSCEKVDKGRRNEAQARQGGLPIDNELTRRNSNTHAGTSGTGGSSPQRRFSAAEKGKQVLSEINKRSELVSTSVVEVQSAVPLVIPGPAGAVQRALAQGRSSTEAQIHKPSSSKQAPFSQEGIPDEDFSKGPWLAALQFIRSVESKEGALESSQLRDVRKGTTGRRTAQLVVIVKSMMPTGEGDAFATVKDPTGAVEGTLHRKLLADKRLGPISAGSALVLQQVAVFRPSPRTCYLNIMATNVVKIFPTKTPVPALRPFSSSSERAFDPALAEPSWGSADRPQSRNGSQSSGGTSRTLVEPERSDSQAFPKPQVQPLMETRNGRLSEASEVRNGQRSQSSGFANPRFGNSHEGAASEPCLLSGDPRKGGVQSAAQAGRRQLPYSWPPVAPQAQASLQGADPGSIQQDASGQRDTSEIAGSRPSAEPFNHTDRANPYPKRGRGDNVSTGLSDALGLGVGAAASRRGPKELSADIQQLLAGLDDEDWFLPGEEVAPPNKKSRELEASLPF